MLRVNPSRGIPPSTPVAAPASNAKHVYIDQGASRTPCFRGNRNTPKSSIPWPRQSNCSASVFALWLATARRHVVIQRPMPSSEHSISTETAALAQGRKTAIPLQRERKRERRRRRIWLQRMRMQWEGDVAAECARRRKQVVGQTASPVQRCNVKRH